MKLGRAKYSTATAQAKTLATRTLRALGITSEGGLSLDGLDATIRALAMLVIVTLSVTRYFWADPVALSRSESASYLLVASCLVLYNLAVVTVLGVPWRRPPTWQLFLFDGFVAAAAVLGTGGLFSPFIVLTYALVIGSTLRLDAPRPLYALAGCVAIMCLSALLIPATVDAPKIAVLAVEVTSLVMVGITALSLKRTLQIEAERLLLQEQSARQLRLLNDLTGSILAGTMDPASVLKTVARVSGKALHSERALAVLFSGGQPGSGHTNDRLLRSQTEPDPVTLSPLEQEIVDEAIHTRKTVKLDSNLTRDGRTLDTYRGELQSILCVPIWVEEDRQGALFVSRGNDKPYDDADASLLAAMSRQMEVGVRLARLYEIEHERAVRSEERERVERDLLSLVSHDLRTPLTAIRTCVDALAEEGSDQPVEGETRKKLVQNIDRNADRLSGMVDDLLDMARLRTGRLQLKKASANMGETLADLAPQIAPLLHTKNQYLQLDLPVRDSTRWHKLTCEMDRRRIEQALINLLSNAHKYAPQSGVITMGATGRDGEIRVFVRDNGPGIPEEERARIFDRFYSGSPSPTGGAGASTSLGLGLAIARSIVELHGGRVWAQSQPGGGSTFFFALEGCAVEVRDQIED